MTLEQLYQSQVDAGLLQQDPAQLKIVEQLQRLQEHLSAAATGNTAGIFRRRGRKHLSRPPTKGLYIWGGVGRGKTWLLDLFYQQLPFKQKRRVHFHRFMRQVHEDLRQVQGARDPLELAAARLLRPARVLCLDEFIVNDIGDAMILAKLLKSLLQEGVTLVTTSNTEPENLYQNGIQRASFLPAIELLQTQMHIMELGGSIDYRLRYLEQAKVYHTPLQSHLNHLLEQEFRRLASEPGQTGGKIRVVGREIPVERMASDVIWFDFMALCGPPRSQTDYLELARCYHTVLISDIPLLGPTLDDVARRFLYLLDEFYDRNVKLIVSAAAPPESLYRGERLASDFQRGVSRLREMQSSTYMAAEHRP